MRDAIFAYSQTLLPAGALRAAVLNLVTILEMG